MPQKQTPAPIAESAAEARAPKKRPRRAGAAPAFVDDVAAQEDESAARAAAFADGDLHRWRGVPLEPFSISRESLYLRMCAADGIKRKWVGEANIARQAFFVLWLCASDKAALDRARTGADDPGAALISACEAWVDENVPRAELSAAVALGTRIYADATANIAEPESSGGSGKK